ncbi:hypothetical protein OH77DRAFT_949492 [Trametes cingulata]|nr:hypothetical protein OH77DRAFT_949492 [Trametes cingulata]
MNALLRLAHLAGTSLASTPSLVDVSNACIKLRPRCLRAESREVVMGVAGCRRERLRGLSLALWRRTGKAGG